MHNKKILIVIGDLNIGGAERHLLRVLPRLRKLNYDITVFTLLEPGQLAAEMIEGGVSVIQSRINGFKKKSPLQYFVSFLKLVSYLKKQKPDIVHFFLARSYLIGSVAALFVRCRNLVMSRRIIYTEEYRKSVFFRLEKHFHKRLTLALACSQAIYNDLKSENIPDKRLGIIYNGIDVINYSHFRDKNFARQQLNLPSDCLVITIVATLHRRKGHVDLLRALSNIKQQLPHLWTLLVVGRDEGERCFLEETANNLQLSSHIRWLGEIKDTSLVWIAADLGVLCSHEEGFSNALLEAMACAVPMVVTRISGNVEAIIEGVNGWLVPVADPLQLGAAILRLVNEKECRETMGFASRERVQQHFSLEKVVADYDAYYQSIIETL